MFKNVRNEFKCHIISLVQLNTDVFFIILNVNYLSIVRFIQSYFQKVYLLNINFQTFWVYHFHQCKSYFI